MNSSVLVSGFVLVGVGAMAILFNPFGSSEDTSSNPTAAYQVAAEPSKSGTATSPVSATVDPEPFVWEDKKETVATTEMFDELKSQKATKEVSKAAKSASDQISVASKVAKTETAPASKLQPVSKPVSSFSDQANSTADADLNDFFGPSRPATKVSKAPAAKAPLQKAKSKPVRVASKPTVNSANNDGDLLSFTSTEEDEFDDAPMLSAVGPKDFSMPTIDPVDEPKVTNRNESSRQSISGSLESVMDKPATAQPVVKTFDIENPLQTRLNVTFLANGQKVSLKPGQHFVVRQAKNMQVKFSRGGSFGFTEESLSEGNYQFSVTRKDGWKLTQ